MSLARIATVSLLANTKQFKREMASAGKSTKAIGDGATKAEKRMATLGKVGKLAGLAVVAGFAASISQFAKFDDALNQSISIMGDVSGVMKGELSDAAREVGLTTRFSATQAAESLFFLASAGLDAKQSIAAMPQVAAFAQAGMFDLAKATDLATDAQSALGLSVDDPTENLQNLTRVTDVLVKANTLANASVEQFAEALTNKAGSAAKVLGKDMEEVVAVLAAFADQGIKGTEAGEKINIVFRDLQTSAIKQADAWDSLNISVFDSAGEMRNIADIIGDLEGVLEGASDEQARLTLMQLGFQDRSVSAIMTLLGTSEAIRQYETDLDSAGGTTEEVSQKQLQSFTGQMELTKSAVQDMALTLGEELAPAALKTAQALVGIFETLGPLIMFVGKLTANFIDLVDRGLLSISSLFGDEAATSALRLSEAIISIEVAARDGKSVYDAYANAVQHLALNGDLTAESLQELNNTAMVTSETAAGAIATNLEWARANGVNAGQIVVLETALRNSIAAMDLTEEEAADLRDQYGLVDAELNRMSDSHGRMGATMGEAQSAAADLGSEISLLEEELLSARNAQESLANVLKAAADPVFAAVSAFKSYGEKLKEIDEDGKRSAEEQIDLASAVIDTQVALDGLSGDALEKALDSIGIALGEDRQHVIDLLNELGILDGMTVVSTVETKFTQTGSGQAVSASGEVQGGAFVGGRQHGGPVNPGQSFLVGESGPEVFIPTTPGSISQGAVDNSRHMTNNFVNPLLANDPVRAIRSRFAADGLAGSF